MVFNFKNHANRDRLSEALFKREKKKKKLEANANENN